MSITYIPGGGIKFGQLAVISGGTKKPEDTQDSFVMRRHIKRGEAYPFHQSVDGAYIIQREYTGVAPNYIPFTGEWVLRRHGDYVDHDTYLSEVLGRHTLRGAHHANKP